MRATSWGVRPGWDVSFALARLGPLPGKQGYHQVSSSLRSVLRGAHLCLFSAEKAAKRIMKVKSAVYLLGQGVKRGRRRSPGHLALAYLWLIFILFPFSAWKSRGSQAAACETRSQGFREACSLRDDSALASELQGASPSPDLHRRMLLCGPLWLFICSGEILSPRDLRMSWGLPV